MPMSERDLLDQYGAAVLARNASLFVGAGMSLEAGYPGWGDLLKGPCKRAKIPSISDLPLMAQYFVLSTPGGREELQNHMLKVLSKVEPRPTKGHELIRRLTVGDIWTTNYDCLLELAIPEARIISSEEDLVKRSVSSSRQITKMHGSLKKPPLSGWRAPPVITRSDYEQYEMLHPRIWALLKASYMTRAFLFLGFSFSDPNIEILLRLSRTLLDVGTPEHFTVLRKPGAVKELRNHELRVQDLESSGIAVHEIDSFDDMVPLLERLVQRTRKARLFISGSEGTDPEEVRAIGKKVGHRLAETPIEIASLAGSAGLAVAFPFGYSLQANEEYSPDRIKFYFRQSTSAPPPLEQRMGTAVYTGWTRERILDDVLPECRATLVLGGGERTMDEVTRSKILRMPVIPIPASGGTAMDVYEHHKIGDLLGRNASEADMTDWQNLGDRDSDVSTAAVLRLVRRSMFLQDPS
jgi:SIR2-like domain